MYLYHMIHTETISKVMTTAHRVKKLNAKAWLNGAKRYTWSECLRLAWKLVQSCSCAVGETARAMIEIVRPNRVGFMRAAGSVGMRFTF